MDSGVRVESFETQKSRSVFFNEKLPVWAGQLEPVMELFGKACLAACQFFYVHFATHFKYRVTGHSCNCTKKFTPPPETKTLRTEIWC